jgi:ERCC4-related helicase
MKNNVRGSIIILEALAIIITATLILRIKANKDVVPPVISFPEGVVSYTQGDDQEVLFSGVSAIDEKDGDVSDSVIISSISVTEGTEAIAVYHAKDTSNNVAMAEKIEGGKFVYSGQDSKKKGRIKIEEFQKATSGHLHTIRKADEGLDIKGLSIAIILGLDSSKTKATQRRGRAIRFEEGKNAEIFNIVINNTVECEWFKNSHKGDKYITIDEKGLEQVLKGEEPTEYKKPIQRFTFRY